VGGLFNLRVLGVCVNLPDTAPLSPMETGQKAVADEVIAFLESLRVPTGKLAGAPLRLAGFQKTFIRGAFTTGIEIGVLSVARGGGKSVLVGGLALAALMGIIDPTPKREVLIAARVREQARIIYQYVTDLIESLPDHEREKFVILKAPRLEIRYKGEGGPHYLKALASDGKSVLGSSPTFCAMDERAFWHMSKGDMLESTLLTGMSKRGGRCVMISTSGPDDLNSFSRWLDNPPAGTYCQDHRPPPGLPADDEASLLIGNPGAVEGIGATVADLVKAAERAVDRGGSALSQFRLLSRNERVSDESRAVLLTTDEWLAVEAQELPARQGPVVIGVDAGESASMSAAAYYWPDTGRLESHAWFPSEPSLLDRGSNDRVGDRYQRMRDRGELSVIGQKTVPVKDWVQHVLTYVQGCPVHAVVADKFKEAALTEGLQQAGYRGAIIWRRFGFYDGDEDINRFRTACLDREIKTPGSLLMRSAIADCVIEKDVNGNSRLAKGRSMGRIDAIAAAVICVAEGKRLSARPQPKAPRVQWA